MILDTTYLLPLAQIAEDRDLLAAVAGRNTDVKLEELVTEDSLILEKKTKLLREYNLRVLSFKDLVKP